MKPDITLPNREVPAPRRVRSGLIAVGLATATLIVGAATAPHAPTASAATAVTAQASGHGVTLAATVDRTRVQSGSDGTVRLELVMRGTADAGASVPAVPTDLVVVIDTSGSMEGQKMVEAKAAVRELIAQLGDGDRFALVRYADDASLDIELATATPAARADWQRRVDELAAGGSTNIGAGIDTAAAAVASSGALGRLARVILISDGIPTAGEISPEGLVARARSAARGEQVLSAVGVGADFNATLMTALADAGTGNYYYINGDTRLATVFADELSSTRESIATALAVRLQPSEGVRVVDAAGYPLELEGSASVFRPGSLFAGQERRVWVTLQLPTDRLASLTLPEVSLAFNSGGARRTVRVHDLPSIACVGSRDEFVAGLDGSAWERAVLQDEYGKMKQTVAEHLRQGDREQAQAAIRAYRAPTAGINAAVRSAAVDKNLAEVDVYAQEVEKAFEGIDQKEKQNVLGKSSSAAGWDMRRAGAKK